MRSEPGEVFTEMRENRHPEKSSGPLPIFRKGHRDTHDKMTKSKIGGSSRAPDGWALEALQPSSLTGPPVVRQVPVAGG